jgi:hypothetical protein
MFALRACSKLIRTSPALFIARGARQRVDACIRPHFTLNAATAPARNLADVAVPATDATFDEIVLKSSVPVVVDFYAE